MSTAPTFPSDNPTPSIVTTVTQPPTTVPSLGPGSIRGALPDGTVFDVYLEPARTESVTGISAGIIVELDDGTGPVAGILDFFGGPVDAPAWDDNTFVIPAGDGSVRLDLYPEVIDLLGPEYQLVVESSIAGTRVADFPVLTLSPPFRWALDEEIPLSMEVSYESFVVHRGCERRAFECSSTHVVQVITTGDPAWPDDQMVWIEAPGDRPIRDAWFLDPGPLGPRGFHDVIWTGEEMIVWGGSDGDRLPHLVEGAAFDPKTGEWRLLSQPPIEPEQATRAHWLGEEMLVMSSESIVAYDPASDGWRIIGPGFRPAVDPGMTVSSGGLVYTWTPGAIVELDPGSGTWRELPRPGFGGYDRWAGNLVSTGDALFAIGLGEGVCTGRRISRWAQDEWIALPVVSLATAELADCTYPTQTAAIDGKLIVWGDHSTPAFAYDSDTDTWSKIDSTTLSGTEGPLGPVDLGDRLLVPQYGEASIYDPASGGWTAVALPGGGEDIEMVWTGQELLMWGAPCCYGSTRFSSQDAWRWTPPIG